MGGIDGYLEGCEQHGGQELVILEPVEGGRVRVVRDPLSQLGGWESPGLQTLACAPHKLSIIFHKVIAHQKISRPYLFPPQ
jgi:hypothetical protein